MKGSLATNIDGLMFPGVAGQTVDSLQAAWRLNIAKKAAEILQKAAQVKCNSHNVETFFVALSILDRLSPDAKAKIFSHPIASLDTTINDSLDEKEPKLIRQQAYRVLRHFVGAPDTGDFTFVVPATEVGDSFFLPHIHSSILLQEKDVIGISQKRNSLSVINCRGLAFTIPIGSFPPHNFRHPLIQVERYLNSISILNGIPEIRKSYMHLDPADENEIDKFIHQLARSIRMLSKFWYEAETALYRHVGGILILNPRAHERSHSPVEICGAIVMTIGKPVTVCDLLCHESSHIRMHWFKHVDPLLQCIDPKFEKIGFKSAWRTDLRPLDGLILGVHAFINVCHWYRQVRYKSPELAQFAIQVHNKQADNILKTFAVLKENGSPTKLGEQLMAAFQVAIEENTTLEPLLND